MRKLQLIISFILYITYGIYIYICIYIYISQGFQIRIVSVKECEIMIQNKKLGYGRLLLQRENTALSSQLEVSSQSGVKGKCDESYVIKYNKPQTDYSGREGRDRFVLTI